MAQRRTLTPAERSARARLASLTRLSGMSSEDRRRSTENARAAAMARFLYEVDPNGVLPPEERAQRAEYARKAHMARISMQGLKTRRQNAARRQSQKQGGGNQ